ncbi:MAG: mercury methylation ferredoxin HgcB [bacterium]
MKMAYLKDVVTLRLDRDACIGCGRCLDVCPHGVFAMADGKSVILDRDACMECGACARNCPAEALRVKNGVGCAVGILNAAFGRKSACCGEDQACCCSESEPGSGEQESKTCE